MVIFNDIKQEEYFVDNGYIKSNFISSNEVKEIIDYYEQYQLMGGDIMPFAKSLGYYISVFDSNLDRRKYIDSKLKDVFQKKIEKIMPNYTILYCNFMTKDPNGTEIEVHQDFSFVDEKKYTAFNFWLPLQYTDAQNGGFHLIEGSHKLFNSYRSATIPHNLTHYNSEFKKYMKEIPVNAGDGLIFDHKLFHYSTPNQTNNVRIAIQMVLIPKDATPVTYYYRPEEDKNNLEVYEITSEYLLTDNLWSDPKNKLKFIGKTPYEKIPDAKSILKKLNKNKSNNILEKINNFFKNV
jgi:hypothetical protein